VYTAIAGTDMVAGTLSASPPPNQTAQAAIPKGKPRRPSPPTKQSSVLRPKSDELSATRTGTGPSNPTNQLETAAGQSTLPRTNSASELGLGEIHPANPRDLRGWGCFLRVFFVGRLRRVVCEVWISGALAEESGDGGLHANNSRGRGNDETTPASQESRPISAYFYCLISFLGLFLCLDKICHSVARHGDLIHSYYSVLARLTRLISLFKIQYTRYLYT
jgi:hypothetical protein